jgi:sugar/nucleoside kinase (ribokinase family)
VVLGEAMVDRISGPAGRPRRGAPHIGGMAANAAVAIRRAGTRVALMGAAGDDPWGRWLVRCLTAHGVDLRSFSLCDGRRTTVARVRVDRSGEPHYSLESPRGPRPVGPGPDGLRTATAVVFGSNALIDAGERAHVLAARRAALSRGTPIALDANLRLDRWPHPGEAVEAVRACLPGLCLLKCTPQEAAALTGSAEPERAADGLREAGVRHVVMSLGDRGVLVVGPRRIRITALPARVVSTVGAGDVLLGTLIGRWAATRFDEAALPVALDVAVREAARATERWGGVD